MKQIRILALATLLALLLAACGAAQAPTAPAGGRQEESSQATAPADGQQSDEPAEEQPADQAQPGETVTVKFWTISLKPTFTDYVNGLIADYEKSNPGVKIEWSDIPFNEVKQKFLTAVASGEVPDVVNLNTDMILQVASTNPDILVKTSEAVPQEKQQEYFEGLWNSTSFQGATYGIPWYVTVPVVMYNKAIFEEAGVEAPPTTFEEIAQIAKQVKDKTGKWGYAPQIVLVRDFFMGGVPLVNEDRTQAAFNTPEGDEVAQYYIDLKEQGYVPEDIFAKGFQGALQLYKEGNLAMLLTGASLLKQVENDAPEIFQNTEVATHPVRSPKLLPAGVMHLAVPAQSQVKEQAVDFALFVTNGENQIGLAKNSVTVPSVKSAVEDPFFQQTDDVNARARKIMAEELSMAGDANLGLPHWAELMKVLEDEYTLAWNGSKSVEQALDDAAQQWNELLQQQ